MNLITIIPSIQGGGAEKLASDLSPYFDSECRHTTYTYNESGKRYPYIGKVVDLEIRKESGLLRRFWRQISIVRKLRNIKKSTNLDVSLSHMFMSNVCNLLSKRNEKVICVLHGEWCARTHNNFVLAAISRYLYRRADIIVPVSDYIRDIFIKYHGSDHHIEVIHNGIEIDRVYTQSLLTADFTLPDKYIVMVGAMRPEKDYLSMLDHIQPFLLSSDYKLVIVGDGNLRTQIEEKIELLGLRDHILLTGNLSNPYPVIRGASLFLLTSFTESFSLVLVEAMRLGVPVLATDCGGPSEIINTASEPVDSFYIGDTGVLIPTLSNLKKYQLQNSIERVLNDEALRSSLRKNGIERSKQFGIDKTAGKYLEVMKKIKES